MHFELHCTVCMTVSFSFSYSTLIHTTFFPMGFSSPPRSNGIRLLAVYIPPPSNPGVQYLRLDPRTLAISLAFLLDDCHLFQFLARFLREGGLLFTLFEQTHLQTHFLREGTIDLFLCVTERLNEAIPLDVDFFDLCDLLHQGFLLVGDDPRLLFYLDLQHSYHLTKQLQLFLFTYCVPPSHRRWTSIHGHLVA